MFTGVQKLVYLYSNINHLHIYKIEQRVHLHWTKNILNNVENDRGLKATSFSQMFAFFLFCSSPYIKFLGEAFIFVNGRYRSIF